MYFVEKSRGLNFLKQFDYMLFIVVIVLSVIGIFVLHSATRVMPNGIDGNKIVSRQLIGLIAGIILSIIISTIDYKDFKTLGIVFYILSMGLLILVLFKGTGSDIGSKSWFKLPLFGKFQPSELAKIAFILVISIFLERIKDGVKDKNINMDVVKLLAYSFLPVGLVLLQPDAGTAMVFMFVFIIAVYICGLPYKYIFLTAGAFFVSTPFLWFFFLGKYQKDRIISFFSPEKYSQGIGYNVVRSKMAIGSGGLFGKGLYKGIQTQQGGVPVKESDFIFSVIGEELGFIWATFIILLMFALLIRCICIAKNSRDSYGSFLVIGVASMFAFHFIENIGMCIGILPVTGIPLPFISQGGTSMITNYIALGIILSVSMRRKKVLFNNSQ